MTTNVLILSTLREKAMLADLRDHGCSVVSLRLDESLNSSIDALEMALESDPPTGLNEAQDTWLPRADDLAKALALRASSAGETFDWDEVPERFSKVLVLSERILPVDLLPCRGSLLGTECIIAHRGAGSENFLELLTAFQDEELPLRRVAHVCTYYPGSTSLHEMDVVSATLGIDNRLAIEHYFYPTEEVATGLFKRSDIDVLHFECHGTDTTLQVDNPYGVPIDVRELYTSNGPRLYFFLGCSAGKSNNSVAATFARRGANGAIGSYCRFLSGGGTGEVSISAYYDALYQGLIGGKTLGESVKAGRRAAAPGRVYYCAWLLFGNPNVRFSLRKFGGVTPNQPLHRMRLVEDERFG